MDFTSKFKAKYKENPITGCWEWIGSKYSRYGCFYISNDFFGQKQVGAHRASYFIHFGEFDPNLHVLHKCDNGFCVNPDHLFLGTHKTNMEDKALKNRVPTPFKKIDEESFRLAKKLKADGKQVKEIAKIIGLSPSHMGRVLKGYNKGMK